MNRTVPVYCYRLQCLVGHMPSLVAVDYFYLKIEIINLFKWMWFWCYEGSALFLNNVYAQNPDHFITNKLAMKKKTVKKKTFFPQNNDK